MIDFGVRFGCVVGGLWLFRGSIAQKISENWLRRSER